MQANMQAYRSEGLYEQGGGEQVEARRQRGCRIRSTARRTMRGREGSGDVTSTLRRGVSDGS